MPTRNSTMKKDCGKLCEKSIALVRGALAVNHKTTESDGMTLHECLAPDVKVRPRPKARTVVQVFLYRMDCLFGGPMCTFTEMVILYCVILFAVVLTSLGTYQQLRKLVVE